MTPQRIRNITIENVHGLTNSITLHMLSDNQNNRNVVIWGHNGSGKSSIYRAIVDFLHAHDQQQTIQSIKHKHRLNAVSRISIEFIDELNQTTQCIWTDEVIPNSPILQECRRTFGRLSYNDVLEISFAYRHNRDVEIFHYLEEAIMSHRTQDNRTLAELHANIKQLVTSNASADVIAQHIEEYNKVLFNILFEIQRTANTYLETYFKHHQWKIIFDQKIGMQYNNQQIIAPKVFLRAVHTEQYHTHVHDDFHHFMNEALVSSIAYSLYFAALIRIPAGPSQFLILDDIQFGFDEDQRNALIYLIETEFKNYQIIFISHNRSVCDFIMDAHRNAQVSWANHTLYRNSATQHIMLLAENRVSQLGLTPEVIDYYCGMNHHHQLLADTRVHMENFLMQMLIELKAEIKLTIQKDIDKSLTLGNLMFYITQQFRFSLQNIEPDKYKKYISSHKIFENKHKNHLNQAHHHKLYRMKQTIDEVRETVTYVRNFQNEIRNLVDTHGAQMIQYQENRKKK